MASVWDEAEVRKAGDGIIAKNEGPAGNIGSESSRLVVGACRNSLRERAWLGRSVIGRACPFAFCHDWLFLSRMASGKRC